MGMATSTVCHHVVTDGRARIGWGSDLGPRAELGFLRKHLGMPTNLRAANLIGAGGGRGSPGSFRSHLTIPRPSRLSTADIMVVFTHKNSKLFYWWLLEAQ